MPSRQILFEKGFYYHLYNRGNNHSRIFFSNENYIYLLKLVKKNFDKFNITMIAYCLMPNHYHFLCRQGGQQSLAVCMRNIFNSYGQAINKQLKRSGSLFEGRFKAAMVDKDNYILHLCRYIHLNPVKAGLVQKPEDWLFSNYLEWIEKRNGTLADSHFIESYFSDRTEYQQFVMDLDIDLPGSLKLPGS